LVLRAFWTLQRREISAMSGIKPKGPWYRIIGENFAVGREIPCLSRLKISLSFSQHPVIGMLDNPSPVNAFKYYLSSIILLLFLHMSNHVIDVCQVSVRNFFLCISYIRFAFLRAPLLSLQNLYFLSECRLNSFRFLLQGCFLL
jgi:hypothetical protein